MDTRPMTGDGNLVPIAGVPENAIRVNCGKCGRAMVVRLEELVGKWTIECAACVDGAQPTRDTDEGRRLGYRAVLRRARV